MITSITRASRAIPIMRVRARCCVPFGLMPVTAAMAVMMTARPSHTSQVMIPCYRIRPCLGVQSSIRRGCGNSVKRFSGGTPERVPSELHRVDRGPCSSCARTIENHRFRRAITATIAFAHRGHVCPVVPNRWPTGRGSGCRTTRARATLTHAHRVSACRANAWAGSYAL